jgi:hypothetical protein
MPKGRSLRPAIMKDPRSRVPYVNRHSMHFPGRAATLQRVNDPVSADFGRVEAVPAFADGRHDLGDPGVEGVKFFRLGRVGDERTSVT